VDNELSFSVMHRDGFPTTARVRVVGAHFDRAALLVAGPTILAAMTIMHVHMYQSHPLDWCGNFDATNDVKKTMAISSAFLSIHPRFSHT
jgi:hypothetical protein